MRIVAGCACSFAVASSTLGFALRCSLASLRAGSPWSQAQVSMTRVPALPGHIERAGCLYEVDGDGRDGRVDIPLSGWLAAGRCRRQFSAGGSGSAHSPPPPSLLLLSITLLFSLLTPWTPPRSPPSSTRSLSTASTSRHPRPRSTSRARAPSRPTARPRPTLPGCGSSPPFTRWPVGRRLSSLPSRASEGDLVRLSIPVVIRSHEADGSAHSLLPIPFRPPSLPDVTICCPLSPAAPPQRPTKPPLPAPHSPPTSAHARPLAVFSASPTRTRASSRTLTRQRWTPLSARCGRPLAALPPAHRLPPRGAEEGLGEPSFQERLTS